MPHLIPLQQFVCDKCGQLIEKPSDGYVEWLSEYSKDEPHTVREFKIIHSQAASPNQFRNEKCHHHLRSGALADVSLEYFLQNAHQHIYSFLNLGPFHDPKGNIPPQVVDFAEFTEFARRLTIPYYEEARQYFDEAKKDADFNGHHEIAIFSEETLLRIIERYGGK